MENAQRMKSDIATMDKRDTADQIMKNHRAKNDEMTMERRIKADEMREESRDKNDEITANRREMKDENPSTSLTVFLLILAILAVGTIFTFM